jgi:hypothetical protein
MRKPATILIDGKPYLWKDLLQMRREQRAAAQRAPQLALFDNLPDDSRPAHERTAADRYRQPSLFTLLAEDPPFK